MGKAGPRRIEFFRECSVTYSNDRIIFYDGDVKILFGSDGTDPGKGFLLRYVLTERIPSYRK